MKQTMMNKNLSNIRIIAGKFRRRKITFPNVESIRPTTDRLRETAFNWLQPYLENANCLDAFAGSGILGFEALSRYAKSVTFVDQLKINIESISANAKKLNIDLNINMHCQDFFSLNFETSAFDVIFLDPPYHQELITKALDFLMAKKWMNEKTIIYIEGEKKVLSQIPDSFKILKQKTTKNIAIALIEMVA